MVKRKFLLLGVLFVILCLPAKILAQTTLTGKAVKIVDGDTFDLLVNGNTTYRIRLLDIDCPERGQDFYKVSKEALGNYLGGLTIKVIYTKKDRHQRILGTVYNGPVNVNMIMVQEGYAWHFKKYSKDQRFGEVEQSARKAKRGLWSTPQPIAPWDFRKMPRKRS